MPLTGLAGIAGFVSSSSAVGPYRYYRLYMTQACTPGSALALYEWEIFETVAGPNVATSATATASSFGFGWTPAGINNGAYDGTGWHAADAALPQWVQLDFGGTPRMAYSYHIQPRTGFEHQAPSDFEFQGSNDGSSWTVLDTQSGLTAGFWTVPAPPRFFDI